MSLQPRRICSAVEHPHTKMCASLWSHTQSGVCFTGTQREKRRPLNPEACARLIPAVLSAGFVFSLVSLPVSIFHRHHHHCTAHFPYSILGARSSSLLFLPSLSPNPLDNWNCTVARTHTHTLHFGWQKAAAEADADAAAAFHPPHTWHLVVCAV